jgi:sugar lactone lactonase YvrE
VLPTGYRLALSSAGMKSKLAPIRWTPPPPLPARSPDPLTVEVVPLPGAGPEDVLIDADGSVLTGLFDGRILRVSADGRTITTLADTGGRPCGLEWLPDGSVLICDARRGLLRMDGDGHLETLVHDIDGRPMKFCNNAAVTADGTIYFTDSSTRFGVDEWKADLLEHSSTGRLLRRTPDGELTMLAAGLSFCNGVALTPDEKMLYVAETASYRLLKLDLTQDGAMPVEAVVVPGLPDNIATGSDGLIWVALGSPRNAILDFLLDKPPVLRQLVWRVPNRLQPKAADVIEIQAHDADGRLVHDLRGKHPQFFMPTGVRERDGRVWLGSIGCSALAYFDRPG